MKAQDLAHQFAEWLLNGAQRLAPPHAREWGEAMRGELDFVQGSWATLAWATGGTRVLMNQTLLNFLTGRSGEAASVPPGRFQAEAPMKKITPGLAILGVAVLAVLLFAPSFQQALSVSMDSWSWVFGRPGITGRQLHRLAERARAEHDAQTLAFVALRLPPGAEGARLADEAVKLDPKLTWIYYSLAARNWPNPKAKAWAERLEAWEPQNAVPHLLVADLEGLHVSNGNILVFGPDQVRADPRWMNAMAAGFAAPKYDSYLAAQLDLDRAVMARHHLVNPLFVLSSVSSLPVPGIVTLQRYAYIVYARGEALEAKGALDQAAEEYWTVARFGQLMHMQAAGGFERQAGVVLQREAYQRLESVAARSNRPGERALLAYQIEILNPPHQELRDNGFWIDVYQWNAEVGQISFLVLLVSVILLAAWGLYFAARRFRASAASGRLEGLIRASGFAGELGLVVSSLTLYLSYHPYAQLFERFAQGSGAAQSDWLMTFWGFAEVPWAVNGMFSDGFWWFALLALAACLLAFEIFRIASGPRPSRAAAL
jgi:uncharacterized RDD family membrane protein YckC